MRRKEKMRGDDKISWMGRGDDGMGESKEMGREGQERSKWREKVRALREGVGVRGGGGKVRTGSSGWYCVRM